MTVRFHKYAEVFVVFTVTIALLSTQNLYAQGSIVGPSELKEAIARAASARQKNLDQVQSFFSSDPVRAAMKTSNMNVERVQQAVSSLSADELARLAIRTQKIQTDFAAGSLSNQDLTYIVIALGAAVLVLIVVAAR